MRSGEAVGARMRFMAAGDPQSPDPLTQASNWASFPASLEVTIERGWFQFTSRPCPDSSPSCREVTVLTCLTRCM